MTNSVRIPCLKQYVFETTAEISEYKIYEGDKVIQEATLESPAKIVRYTFEDGKQAAFDKAYKYLECSKNFVTDITSIIDANKNIPKLVIYCILNLYVFLVIVFIKSRQTLKMAGLLGKCSR